MHYFGEEREPMAPDPDTLRHTLAALRDHEREKHRETLRHAEEKWAAGSEPTRDEETALCWHGGRLDLLERLLTLLGGVES
jgi:hypothetical protein